MSIRFKTWSREGVEALEDMDINEERLAFYFEIGLSITQWAHVELELSGIVMDCFDPKQTIQAILGFRSIENFRSKLQFVEAVIYSQRLPEQERPKWMDLRKWAQHAANKRNQLAHRFVLTDQSQPQGRRAMLLPLRPQTGKQPKRPPKYRGAICLQDIVGYRQEFSLLTQTIENFRARLDRREEPHPELQELPKHPPTIAQIQEEIRAFAEHLPRPSRE